MKLSKVDLGPLVYSNLDEIYKWADDNPMCAFFLNAKGDLDLAPFSRLRMAFKEEVIKGGVVKMLVARSLPYNEVVAFFLVTFMDGIELDVFFKVITPPCLIYSEEFKESVLIFLKYVFLKKNRHKAMCQLLETEKDIVKILVSVAFNVEGLKQEEIFCDGRFFDLIPLSITKKIYMERCDKGVL